MFAAAAGLATIAAAAGVLNVTAVVGASVAYTPGPASAVLRASAGSCKGIVRCNGVTEVSVLARLAMVAL